MQHRQNASFQLKFVVINCISLYTCLCEMSNQRCLFPVIIVRPFLPLLSNLAVSIDNIFGCCQSKNTHRTSRMEFLRTDPDLSPITKLKSVCESGRSVYIYCCRVYLIQEFLCIRIILCDDCLRMACVILIDMQQPKSEPKISLLIRC